MTRMKLLYISQGNIPSRWAHTFQAMKMAEAFAAQVEDFALLTQVHWASPLRPRFDYESWYGIARPFRIRQILTREATFGKAFEGVRYPRFDERAAAYAAKTGARVYTRSPYAACQAARRGVPTVLETHMETNHPEFRRVLEACTLEALRGVVTITEEIAVLYREAGVTAPILVRPDAVSPEAFEGLPPARVLRRELGLPEEGVVALFCGNLYADRGIGDVVECAGMLADIHFVLVGGWDRDVAQWRERTASAGNVRFTGFAPNSLAPRYLMAADILLMPNSSTLKTAKWMSPMKMFEYMAAGKPLVAQHHAVLEHVLRDGQNCLFTPPDDARAMAEAVGRLAGDAGLRARLGEAARRDVGPYTWRNRARDVLERFFDPGALRAGTTA